MRSRTKLALQHGAMFSCATPAIRAGLGGAGGAPKASSLPTPLPIQSPASHNYEVLCLVPIGAPTTTQVKNI